MFVDVKSITLFLNANQTQPHKIWSRLGHHGDLWHSKFISLPPQKNSFQVRNLNYNSLQSQLLQ